MSDEPDPFRHGVLPRSNVVVEMPAGAKAPDLAPSDAPSPASAIKLLRIPASMQTVDEVLAVAGKIELDDILILSQREDGTLVWLHTQGMTVAEANWLIDQAKMFLLAPDTRERKGL